MFELTTIAVFASAKEEVSKPTGLCRKCCKTDEVDCRRFQTV
jgi:hypothetical protein